jgi:hypothetical protein
MAQLLAGLVHHRSEVDPLPPDNSMEPFEGTKAHDAIKIKQQ